MNGYILESRTILESDIWKKPPMYFKVWHYLLMNAQHTNYRNLKRGQLFTSIDQIREACSYYVGYRKVKPSRKEIYGILEWLRNPHEGDNEGNDEGRMIVTMKVTHGMVISIVNYGVFQDPKFYEGNNEGRTKVTTKRTRRSSEGNNTNKNDKKKNKNEKILSAGAQKKIPPARSDVEEYCRQKNYHIDLTEFFSYYDLHDWTLGNGRKITNWTAAVDYWSNKGKKLETNEQTDMPYYQEFDNVEFPVVSNIPFENGLASEVIRRKREKVSK